MKLEEYEKITKEEYKMLSKEDKIEYDRIYSKLYYQKNKSHLKMMMNKWREKKPKTWKRINKINVKKWRKKYPEKYEELKRKRRENYAKNKSIISKSSVEGKEV